MTFEKSLWSQDPVAGYAARLDRGLIAAMWDEGVMSARAFRVTQRAAGANFTVDVAAGAAVIAGDDQANQGNYYAKSTATINVPISAAPGSNSRFDILVARHHDSNAGGAGTSAGQTTTAVADFNTGIAVIAGTAAASPTVPAVPASCLLLAVIGPITSATASITDALIHDCRTGTGPAEAANARRPAGRRDHVGTLDTIAGPICPNGWLFAAGQAVSRSTFADLFAELGTIHGAGDGSTTFNVPDFRGRTAFGLDNMGGTDAGRLSVANTLGGTGGTQTVTLADTQIPAHVHSIAHDHAAANVTEATFGTTAFVGVTPLAAGGTADVGLASGGTNALQANLPPFAGNSGSAGGGQAHDNMPPYVLANVIIRT